MKRDAHGIIGQTDVYDINYFDFGDSAFSTGIMAMTGSMTDVKLMPQFVINGKICRHPYDIKWSNTDLTSRDQVVAFFAGLPQLRPFLGYEVVQNACLNYAKSWKVNSDVLLPNIKVYLYKCANVRPPLWLLALALPLQVLALLWDAFVKPKHEMNQSICVNSVYGTGWLRALKIMHPDLNGNIAEYYNGWRDKTAIGNRLMAYINARLSL